MKKLSYIKQNAMKIAVYGLKRCKELQNAKPACRLTQRQAAECYERHLKAAKYLAKKGY